MTPPMNPHQKPQEDVVVTQEDREAASALDDALGFLTATERPIVEQAFARHRLLGHEAGRRDMREAAGKVAESLKRQVPYEYNGHPCLVTMRRVATAIRALPTEPLGGEG